MTYFVVTKDYKSFREYCRATNRQIGVHCAFVDSPARLKGYTNPNGVLVGDWDQHPYITDILQSLLIQSTDPEKIRKIRRAREILAARRGYVQVNQMVNKSINSTSALVVDERSALFIPHSETREVTGSRWYPLTPYFTI